MLVSAKSTNRVLEKQQEGFLFLVAAIVLGCVIRYSLEYNTLEIYLGIQICCCHCYYFFCSCVHFSLFRFIYLCIEFYLSLSSFFADVAERKSVSGKSNDISAFVVMIVSILLRVCVALETVSLGKVMQKQCILFKRVWTKKISIKWSICRSRARFLLYLASIFRSSCFKILCKHSFDILLGAVFHLCVLYLFIWTVISLDSCFLLYELVL